MNLWIFVFQALPTAAEIFNLSSIFLMQPTSYFFMTLIVIKDIIVQAVQSFASVF